MTQALLFADAVGRKKMAETLEVGTTAISNAVVRGWFPASWFLTCQMLAEEKGIECPPSLFGMKEPSTRTDAA